VGFCENVAVPRLWRLCRAHHWSVPFSRGHEATLPLTRIYETGQWNKTLEHRFPLRPLPPPSQACADDIPWTEKADIKVEGEKPQEAYGNHPHARAQSRKVTTKSSDFTGAVTAGGSVSASVESSDASKRNGSNESGETGEKNNGKAGVSFKQLAKRVLADQVVM
jgi:hypothetical protein